MAAFAVNVAVRVLLKTSPKRPPRSGPWAIRRGITQDDYDRNARALKDREIELQASIEQHQTGDGAFRTTMEGLPSVASRAADLFTRSNIEQKRELLGFAFSNLALKGRELQISWRSPFDLMVNRPDHASWLAFLHTVRKDRFQAVLALAAPIKAIRSAA